MSREKKILLVCLAISAISTIIMVISTVISPETSSMPVLIAAGVVPIVLLVAILSAKKDDKK